MSWVSMAGIAALVVVLSAAPPVAVGAVAAAVSPDISEVWTPPESAELQPMGDPEMVSESLSGEKWEPLDESRFSPESHVGMRAPAGTVAGAPGLGELPWFSFQDFAISPDTSAQVNTANGNLLVKANDLALIGPGVPLRQDRFYNGLSTRAGTMGGGWQSSTQDIGLDIAYGSPTSTVTFYAPNGGVFVFTRQDPSTAWQAQAGSNLTLESSTGFAPFKVRDNKSNDVYWFDQTGYLLEGYSGEGVGYDLYYDTGAANRVTHATHMASGRSLYWSYPTGSNAVSSVTDFAGRSVRYGYDTSGRLNKVTAVDNRVTTYTYDSVGRLASMTVPGSLTPTTTVSFTYDTSHRVLTVTEDPAVVTTFAYSAGQTTVTDPNGHSATFTVDAQGRVTSAADALNRTRAQTWTTNSDVASATDALGSNTATYTYDQTGNRLSVSLPTGAAASAAYTAGVGCTAPMTGTAFQPKCSTDDAGATRQYEYTSGGSPIKVTNTTGGTSTVEMERTYDTVGGAVCGGKGGQVCSAKDGNGNTTTYTYNSKGDLTTVTPPAPLGATTYGYDIVGRVTSVIDGNGKTTTYSYTARDRVVLTTFHNAQTLYSQYHPNGLEKARIDSAGNSINFEYDQQGRLTKQTGPHAGVTQTYTYDEVGNMLTYVDAGGTTTYTYDVANQLTKLTEPGGTCPASGNPAANSGCILFEYDPNAAESKRVLPGGANTVTVRDNAGRPTRITAKTGAGSVAVDIGYSYTPTGGTGDRLSVQSRTAYMEQGVTAGAVTSYTYDARNRLTLAQEKTGNTVSASWAYGYDNAGNRTTQTRSGTTGATAGTINYAYNAANQLTSATGQVTTWTYDAVGNQIRNGLTGVSSAYDGRGAATQIGTTANTYAGVGNTDRLAAGTATFNSGALGLMQRTESGSTQRYTRTPEGAAVGYRAAASRYYVQDHLGSVVGIFSGTGTYSGGYSYSPYGEARATGTSTVVTANPLRYIGGHHESGGVYKLGARYYDSSLGRFTQMDPSGQEANPYAYATNDPINGMDPNGLMTISTAVKLIDALMTGGDVYELFAAESTSDGLSAAFSIACGTIAGLIAAPTVVGTIVAAVGCQALGELFDYALEESMG